MKIICQSCGAKYTIADDKVRGRTVKIRCKKCSSAIVVQGPSETPAFEQEEEKDDATRVYSGGEGPEDMAMSVPPQDQGDPGWIVTLDDGAQREGTVEELRAMYEGGTIHEDSYVWREGMVEWQPLGSTPELLNALRGGGGMSGPPRPGSAAPVQGAPDAKLGGNLFGGGGEAARVETRGADRDLFGGPSTHEGEGVATSAPSDPMAKPPVPKFTAERGENSVLFTIDTIKAMGSSAPGGGGPQPAGPAKAPSTAPDDDRVDFRALASVAPAPMESSNFDQPFDPGPVPGAVAGGSLSAPTLPTEIEPEPEPEPEPMPMPYQASMEPESKSNKGIVIGLAVAVALLLVVGLGFGGYMIFGTDEEPVAANTESDNGGEESAAAAADPDTKGEDTKDEDTKDEDTKDEDTKDEDTKDEDTKDGEDGEDEEASKDKAKGDSASARATSTVGGPLPKSTSKNDKGDKKKDDKKKKAEKDDKKDEDDSAESKPRGKFSRSAAISALGAAASAASGCKKPGGPTGRGRVSVTFAPSGRVTTAVVNGPPFSGTSVGGCVAATFRRARVPAFKGSAVTVHKSFTIR